jgi:hypothetical protein
LSGRGNLKVDRLAMEHPITVELHVCVDAHPISVLSDFAHYSVPMVKEVKTTTTVADLCNIVCASLPIILCNVD